MAGLMPVEGKIRDIQVDVSDSCNCCCFGWRVKKNTVPLQTHMYINSNGVAVVFDPKKAEDEMEALKRTVSHLKLIIEHNASATDKEVEDAHQAIQEHVGTRLDEEEPVRLTYHLIERINTAIKDIF